jgi:hypothetical protein
VLFAAISLGHACFPLEQASIQKLERRPPILFALHLRLLLSEAHRDYNGFRGSSHPDSDFALQNEPLLHYKDLLHDAGKNAFGGNAG